MYYAMYKPYGIRTMSFGDMLLKFRTKKERDDYVYQEELDGSDYHRINVDRDAARTWFPAAFGLQESLGFWASLDGHEIWTASPTGGGYRYM